jgi:sugar lactone lactonase YvrE
MTTDFRERLQDLAGEMPALHAPGNLEARVHRREARLVAAGLLSVVAVVLVAVVSFRVLDQAEPVKPANPKSGFPFPIAGTPERGTKTLLQAPEDLMVDANGNLFISEWYGNVVDVLRPHGLLATIAGKGRPGYSGDDGPAISANIDSPAGMAMDGHDLLFVDNGNSCIRRIDLQGTITTVAGTCGVEGYSGDNGPATEATLSRPLGLVMDPNGGFYFSDNDHGLVRHVDASGTMSTIAGAGSVSPFHIGPGGVKASDLDLGRTSYIALDRDGNLYVTDLRKNIVVKIDASGSATLYAGTGTAGYSGDGGLATQAELNFPSGLATDDRGNLFVTDSMNNVIREIGTDGIIRTVAGSGVAGNSGDGGLATKARLDLPSGLAFANGMLYIADQNNDLVRRVDPSGTITTVAGVYK